MRFAVVIEKMESNYSAQVPALPGCIATGATIGEVEALIREAVTFHIDGLMEDHQSIPEPTSLVKQILPKLLY